MLNLEKNFKLITQNDVESLVFNKWQDDSEIVHCFTTRNGGVSTDYLASLNLGFNQGDLREHVIENYQRVCKALKVDFQSLVLTKQVHETNIIKVQSEDTGHGIFHSNKWESADGLYTREPNITLVTHYADCVPLLFYAPGYSIVGMTHAGWRGTVKEIAKILIDLWKNKEHIPLEAIQVVIGPSIGSCCFEVGVEVSQIFLKQFGRQPFIKYHDLNDQYHIDLWQCNKYILLHSGIKEENIFISGVCTSCNDDLFFSHRKTNGNRGTLGAFMALK